MSRRTVYEDGTYLERNPTWHEEHSPWKAEQVVKILRNNNIIPARVCEIGCGVGGVLECLAHEYGDAVAFSGYDISPQALELCRKKERQNLHFFLKDLPNEDVAPFDVVLAIDVFEHVEDCFGFLRKLRGKGTFKVFHIPLSLSVQAVLRSTPILKSRQLVGHIHYFTKETALAVLEDTGYEIVDCFYTAGSLEFPRRGWKSNVMKLLRSVFFALHQDWAVRILGGFSLLVLAR